MNTEDKQYVEAVVDAAIDDINDQLKVLDEKVEDLYDIIEEYSFSMRNLRNEG